MPALAPTPVFPEATLVGVLSAQLRRPRPRSGMSAQRRFRPVGRWPPRRNPGRRDLRADAPFDPWAWFHRFWRASGNGDRLRAI